MSKSIVIDKESYIRTKKKLKKSLETKGVSLTLSEVSDVLAQSLGFKNEFDIQKNHFDKIIESPKLDNLGFNEKKYEDFIKKMLEPSNGIVIQTGATRSGMSFREYVNLNKIIESGIFNKDIKGNIIVYGATGVGKKTLMDKLSKEIKINEKNNSFFSNDDIRKHSLSWGKTKDGMSMPKSSTKFLTIEDPIEHLLKNDELRTKKDLDNLISLNKSGYNLLVRIHANSEKNAYKRLKYLGGDDINFHYTIGIKFINNNQIIEIHDIMKNIAYVFYNNEIKIIK